MCYETTTYPQAATARTVQTWTRTAGSRLRALLAALVAVLVATALPAPAPAAALATGTEPCYYIRSEASGHFLSIESLTYDATYDYSLQLPDDRRLPSSRMDARVVVAPRTTTNSGRHQIWVRYKGYLVSKHNGFSLDIDDDSTARGTPVVVNSGVVSSYAPGSRAADQWDIDASGVITERRTGLVLDVEGNRTAPDSPVIVWTRKAEAWGANQRWTLIPLAHRECYPPLPTSSTYLSPNTHTAANDGSFLDGNGDPSLRFTARFIWLPQRYCLETTLMFATNDPDAEYRYGDVNSLILYRFPTVRIPAVLQRNLPPVTDDISYDVWCATSYLGFTMNWAPEELYAIGRNDAFPTTDRPAFAGRLLPILQSSGDSTNQ